MRSRLVTIALAVAALVVGMPLASSAAFFASSTATATVRAAADWTPPTVSLDDPGSPVKGTVTLTATAADAETGVASVTLQYRAPNGTSWVTLCTDTTAPYSCSWNTVGLADGSYSLRALAVDNAGYSTTSATRTTTVANNILVILDEPADIVRGTVPLSVTLYNAGSVSYTVRFEWAPAGTTGWKTICTDNTAPYTCNWVTTSFANQDYDLRAVAVSGSVTHVSEVVTDVLVDNLAPTVSMVDPGSPLRGTVTLMSNASDAHSGVAQVQIQYAVTGTTTWRDACTIDAEPFSCRFDSTRLVDGSYSFRAVATDFAGNTTTSATVSNRLVDNTVSSVSLNDPGTFLRGTVSVSAEANSTAGVTAVRFQRAVAGSNSWTDLCTDATAPYGCAWDTTTVADGLYDLRAIMTDGAGGTTTSAVLANRRVDNTPFRGVDVQTANGGSTPGKLEVGDQVQLTFSKEAAPTSISAGWDGSPVAVTLRIRDGNLFNLGNKADMLDVLRNGAPVNLGMVNLREDYIKSGKTSQFNATMVLTTTTVDGVAASRVTITTTSGVLLTGLRTVSTPMAMTWTPSAAVRDLSGAVLSEATVTELGALDREF
jgi:hypothetical protein